MKKNEKRLMVLMADDDPDDCLLAMEAIKNSFSDVELKSVRDGIELIEYLRCTNSHSLLKAPPLPDLILLDLNMPKKNGFDALASAHARDLPADIAYNLVGKDRNKPKVSN